MINRLCKTILAAAAIAATFLSASAADWKLHQTFDAGFKKVIDTPQRVYVQALGTTAADLHYKDVVFSSIFVYDKEADELLGYNARNYLSGTMVSTMAYNAQKGYLLIVYTDSNIDMLYDDGKVYNIPGLVNASLVSSKSANGITFDPQHNQAYIATNFGYLVLNDTKHEISESHIYNKGLQLAGRSGDEVLLVSNGNLYSSPASDPHLSFDEFKQVKGITGIADLLPLNDGVFALIAGGKINIGSVSDNTFLPAEGYSPASIGTLRSTVENKDGYLVTDNSKYYQLNRDNGTFAASGALNPTSGAYCSSWDLREFWEAIPRTGIQSKRLADNNWTVTRQPMLPNAPAVLHSDVMKYVPGYGLLVLNHAYHRFISGGQEPYLLSALKAGEWTPLAPAYTNPGRTNVLKSPDGLAIDPDNPRYVYSGSRWNGLARFNLDDPDDILHMSHPADADAGNPGFATIIPSNGGWNAYCQFSAPSFDRDGNLWTTIDNGFFSTDIPGGLWVWPSADRKAGNTAGWKNIQMPSNLQSPYTSKVLGLKNSAWSGAIAVTDGCFESGLVIMYSGDTPTDTSDDRVVYLNPLYDQDGVQVDFPFVYNLYEDPANGNLWVLGSGGVFIVKPSNIASGVNRVHRIKVARNDGTNLADYLLDGAPVFDMTTDGSGNKWFATNGGLICTSADGSQILKEFTAENSFLPHDAVWGIGYNPESNSILASTDYGIAEYFISGANYGSESDQKVNIYPNPVRPDYLGWITIEGVPDGAVVKILDSSGGLVKELDRAEGGLTRWDATNRDNRRVKTGVYFVAASASSDSGGFSNVGKVLVVN